MEQTGKSLWMLVEDTSSAWEPRASRGLVGVFTSKRAVEESKKAWLAWGVPGCEIVELPAQVAIRLLSEMDKFPVGAKVLWTDPSTNGGFGTVTGRPKLRDEYWYWPVQWNGGVLRWCTQLALCQEDKLAKTTAQ